MSIHSYLPKIYRTHPHPPKICIHLTPPSDEMYPCNSIHLKYTILIETVLETLSIPQNLFSLQIKKRESPFRAYSVINSYFNSRSLHPLENVQFICPKNWFKYSIDLSMKCSRRNRKEIFTLTYTHIHTDTHTNAHTHTNTHTHIRIWRFVVAPPLMQFI